MIFLFLDDKLKSSRLILGDKHAEKVIKCLVYIAQLYGEQVILLQYIPSIIDLVSVYNYFFFVHENHYIVFDNYINSKK